MRINNNVAAFNANRNLSTSNMSLGKSLEKLSSGFRINRAGDDAAGLTISQGLRAQASGLKQATRNAQDGISVIQTAEGALTEVHSMLNRMRDLAVQANNTGTQDATAIDASEKEYIELGKEIDRISQTTKFGSKSLLDGSFGAAFSSTGTATAAAAAGGTLTFDDGTNPAITVNIGASASADAIVQAVNEQAGAAGVTASVSYGPGGKTFKFDGTKAFTVGGTALADVGTPGNIVSIPAAKGNSFQVGANNSADDRISVTIASMSTTGLGISTMASSRTW